MFNIINNEICLRQLNDDTNDYNLLYNWCKNPNVYEYFEQRILNYNEIVNKYKSRISLNSNIVVMIIEYNNIPIGIIQYSKIDNKKKIEYDIEKSLLTYEIDIFIGISKYYNKGIGTNTLRFLTKYLFENLNADCLVLVPQSKNIRAIKCYEKVGYIKFKEIKKLDTLGKNLNNNVVMKLERKVYENSNSK